MKHAFLLAVLSEALLATACGSVSPHTKEPFDVRFQTDLDQQPVDTMEPFLYTSYWEIAESRVARPIYRITNLPGIFDVAALEEAQNVNSWDEAPDSCWFTNRIGRRPLSPDELLRREMVGPEESGSWTVVAGKGSGVSDGFAVVDPLGQLYFIKFDPPGLNGLVTGAEMITTLIMNGAGYNVPYNFLRFVQPGRFVLSESAKIPGKYGKKRQMTQEDLEQILARQDRQSDGTIRIIASRAIEGKPTGFFAFEGKNHKDRNDRIPHQDRRELRGVHLIGAWTNNTDLRTKNTLDAYVGEPPHGFLRHYFLDFGSTLGSSGTKHKSAGDGYELAIDYRSTYRNLMTLGFNVPYWQSNASSGFNSVGIFESQNFDPDKWSPWWSNAALEAMTQRDGFWAARIVMGFSDGDVALIARAAKLPEPGAEAYVIKTLIERRDKIGATWFWRMTPLDDFEMVQSDNGMAPKLEFSDLAVRYRLGVKEKRLYQYSVKCDRGAGVSRGEAVSTVEVPSRSRADLGDCPSMAPNHLKISIDVVEDQTDIGEGVDVFAYCWSKERCLITGLERH